MKAVNPIVSTADWQRYESNRIGQCTVCRFKTFCCNTCYVDLQQRNARKFVFGDTVKGKT